MINRRLALLGGVGAAGLISKAAQADQNFTSFSFNTISGTNARTEPDRWGDIVNVKDFGAVGDGSTDDRAAIQTAIDTAFGTAGSPHGTSATLNYPLFFPNGNYRVSSALVFTQVRGAHIFGAGQYSTRISGPGTVISTNGMDYCLFENIGIDGPATGPTFELDWTGGGSVGLTGNIFCNVSFALGDYGIRIGASGNAGTNNQFYNCNLGNVSTTTAGLVTWSASAVGNIVIGGGSTTNTATGSGIWVRNGQVSCASDFATGNNLQDYLIASAEPMLISGCRTESKLFCNITSTGAMVTLQGCFQNHSPADTPEFCRPAGTAGVGAKVIIDSCVNDNATGVLSSNAASQGKVYIRGCGFANAGFTTAFVAAGGNVVYDI